MKRSPWLPLTLCLCALWLSGCRQSALPPDNISYTWRKVMVSLPLDEEEYYTLLAAGEGDLLQMCIRDRSNPPIGPKITVWLLHKIAPPRNKVHPAASCRFLSGSNDIPSTGS